MVQVANPVLILFIVSLSLAFLLRFIKDKVWKQIDFKEMISRAKLTLPAVLPYLGLFGLAQHFKVDAGAGMLYFGIALAASFVLSGMKLPSYLSGILLTGGSMALSLVAPEEAMMTAVPGALLGLLAFKVVDNLCFAEQSTFDDIAGALIWLTGVMWFHTVDEGKIYLEHLNTLAGVISITYLLKFFQGPFVSIDSADDKWYVKRVVLSASGALGLLIVLVKLLNQPEMPAFYMSLLVGAGFFVTYMLKNVDSEARYAVDAAKGVKVLMLMGILYLVATRVHGSYGLLLLAPACVLAPVSGIALLPGLFFVDRVLLQVFVQNFNLNVTGINLIHQYTGAAMYAGFLLAIVLTVFFKEITDRRVLLVIMTATGIVVPVLSNYLLHAEPTSSLLVSLLVASTLLAMLAPSLQRQPAKGTENILLLAPLASVSAILTSGIIEAGNEATIADKTTILGYGVGLVLLATLVYWLMLRKGNNTPAAPAGPADPGASAAA